MHDVVAVVSLPITAPRDPCAESSSDTAGDYRSLRPRISPLGRLMRHRWPCGCPRVTVAVGDSARGVSSACLTLAGCNSSISQVPLCFSEMITLATGRSLDALSNPKNSPSPME